MKKIMILAIMLAPLLTLASFKTSTKSGKINCAGKDIKLTINASRTAFSTVEPGDDNHPQSYRVTKKNSDGKSFVTYTGENNEGYTLTVSLANANAVQAGMSDVLQDELNHITSLKCK